MFRNLCVGISLVLILSVASFAQTDETQTKKTPPGTPAVTPAPTPVAVSKGVATLSPENSKIEFVGIHVGADPKPRLGGFAKFSGQLTLADDGKSVSGVSLVFNMDSLWTQIPKLTTHLKTADFFDVAKYPTSKFESTKVTAGDKTGMVIVAGNLSLHGETREVTFPAKFELTDEGVLFKSEFKLDRTEFGMDKMTDRVVAEVAMNLSIGEKTTGAGPPVAQAPGQGRRRGPVGRLDPAEFFKGLDKDGDGKLSGNEIPERMRQGLSRIDTDGDGSVSLEEIKARFQQGGIRGGGNPSGGGGANQ